MADILSKTELFNAIQTKFPDNFSGQITAQDIRDFLDDFVTSNLIQHPESVNSTPYIIDSKIDSILFEAGSLNANLPPILEHKDRFLFIGNASGATVEIFADGTDTVNGQSSLKILDGTVGIIAPFGTLTDWQTVSNTRARISVTICEEDNALETVINTTGVYEDINCNLGACGGSNLFSVANNVVTYLGDIDLEFEVNASFSVICDSNDKMTAFKVIKNKGEVSEAFLDGKTMTNAHSSKDANCTLFARTMLTKNDKLHYVVASVENTANLTVTNITGHVDEE